MKQFLLNDVSDAAVLQVTPAVISRSVHFLENFSLRAMDALLVASAFEWEADLFVTSDKRQFDSAARSGLQTNISANHCWSGTEQSRALSDSLFSHEMWSDQDILLF